MRIDSIDGTMICNDEDIQTVLSCLSGKKRLSEYIEKYILEIVLKQLKFNKSNESEISEMLDRLPDAFMKETVNSIEGMYIMNENVNYFKLYLPYLMYYLPANVFKVWKPIIDLLVKNELKPELSILDLGAGPGSVPIGIIEFYKELALSYS